MSDVLGPSPFNGPPHDGGLTGTAARRAATPLRGVLTLPAGCLTIFGGIVLVALVLVVLGLGVAFPGYRSTPIYREALRLVNEHDEAREALGAPVVETGLVSFISDFSTTGEGTRRLLSLRVSGGTAEGTLYAEGREQGGRVSLGTARLTLPDGRRLSLLPALAPATRPGLDSVFPRGDENRTGR